MRIAFVSYEYPPDTGVGGIATYVRQMALLLSQSRISTEVVCASPQREGRTVESEFLSVTRVKCRNTEEFREQSPLVVARLHTERPIDLVEVPEYGAEGLYMKRHLPGVPLIVKLHTPKFLIKELNDFYFDQLPLRKIKRLMMGAYNREKDPEFQAIKMADFILSPSRSLVEIVSRRWNIPMERIHHAPNPYFPNSALLDIAPEDSSNTVLYVGRLETRKGVYNLSKAIPLILSSIPNAQFIFLGRDSRGPRREASMKKVMLKEIGSAASNTRFIDHLPLAEVPSVYAQAGICVFPSLWENFPNVCLEAMSAARPVVASREGGMVDMLEDIHGGIFIDPHSPQSIAQGIIDLLKDKTFRRKAGQGNREKATAYYGSQLPLDLIERYRSFISV